MDFLGLYNLFMALAIAGACGTSGNYDASCDDYGVNSGYTDDSGGANTLPPAWTVIDQPPTMVDNGYNPAFYWNRPDNDYADENGVYPGYASDGYSDRYADNGYAPAYQGYSAAYPSYAAAPAYAPAPAMNYGAATTDAGYQGAYAEYDNGYDVEADGYGYGYYQRPIPYERARHERRAAMARMPHDQMHGVNSDMPATVYDRYDTGRDMSGATDHRGAGYNGHDRRMFEDNHGPAKPTSANYQGRDNKNDGRNRPRQ